MSDDYAKAVKQDGLVYNQASNVIIATVAMALYIKTRGMDKPAALMLFQQQRAGKLLQ